MRENQNKNDEKIVRQLMHFMNVYVMQEYFKNGPNRIDHRVVTIADFWTEIIQSPSYKIYDAGLHKSIMNFYDLWSGMITKGEMFYFSSNDSKHYVFGNGKAEFDDFNSEHEQQAYKFLTSNWARAFILFRTMIDCVKEKFVIDFDDIDDSLKRIDNLDILIPNNDRNNSNSNMEEKQDKSKKVFIVHGHDVSTRNEVELFVKSIGYDPIILCKVPDGGATIIEKIEREAKDVCYAIVIYSHCDDGKAKEDVELKPRARQNVVFEHGYMYGFIGRNKVCALLENGVEQPGDLQGVIYKIKDNGGVWKYDIAKEMKAQGLEVDMDKI